MREAEQSKQKEVRKSREKKRLRDRACTIILWHRKEACTVELVYLGTWGCDCDGERGEGGGKGEVITITTINNAMPRVPVRVCETPAKQTRSRRVKAH